MKILISIVLFISITGLSAQINFVEEDVPPPPPKINKVKQSKGSNINTNPYIRNSLTNFFPDSIILKSQSQFPIFASGDYDEDEIRDIAILTKSGDEVKLSIVHRDKEGKLKKLFTSKNLTTKILASSRYGTTLASRSSLPYGSNLENDTPLLQLFYRSETDDLDLYFYYNSAIASYCVSKSEHTVYHNKELDKKTTILNDYLINKKQTIVHMGSNKSDWAENELNSRIILLSDLNYELLKEIIK